MEIQNNNLDKNYPKFSVAMSVYKNDKPEWFDIALDSIITQTISPNEIVLVKDGPVSVEIHKIIEKYESLYKSLFKVIEFKENKGLGIALKTAVENCSYDLIARMDSDDISVNNRFEQQLKYFKNNSNLDIIGGNISEFIDRETNVIGKRVVPETDSQIKDYMKCRCPLNHVTVMFRKSFVLKFGKYIDWFWNEDYYLWIRMLLDNAVFANTGTVLVNVRVGNDMYARRGGIKYFISEARLQKFMYKKGIISFIRAFINIMQRLILQVIMPNWCRAVLFKTFARKR